MPISPTTPLAGAGLPIRLDPTIPNQALRVRAGLRDAITGGRLRPGLRLPSSRALAEELGVGRNAVVAAFEHLIGDGLIEARRGAGTYVAAALPPPPGAPTKPDFAPKSVVRRPCALGVTHVEPALLARLGAAARRRIAGATAEALGYGDPRGDARLRARIAEFLAVNRGLRCDPDCVMIVSGTQHGLRLCVDALLSPGDPVWMEEPGYGASKSTLIAGGARLVPVPVDSEGIDVEAGLAAEPRARAVYVTPSHQFPTGAQMSMARRVRLLDFAREAGAWVFEDDYDSEYRYSGPPLTALAGIAGERVIYLGTFAKTLFPGLRIGYMALPPEAVAPVAEARASLDRFPPAFMQAAVADLMEDGGLAAHARRMRVRYAAARDALVASLSAASPRLLSVDAPQQGLHLIARLGPDLPPEAAPEIRRRADVDALLLSEARLGAGGPEGFILGFSGFEPAALGEAGRRLVEAARSI